MDPVFHGALVYAFGLMLALPYATHWVYADHVRTIHRHSPLALFVCVFGAIAWPLMLAIVLLFFLFMMGAFILWRVARPVVDNRPWRRKNV